MVTYNNTILDFFTTEEDGLERAEELFKTDLPRYNIKPDLQAYNTLIEGAARSGPKGLAIAYKWLQELHDQGYVPDELIYRSVVSASAAAGDAPRALDFFRECEEERAKRAFASSSAGGQSGSSERNGRMNRMRSTEFNLLSHPAAYNALLRAFLTSHKQSGGREGAVAAG